jgi:hypothetical protein
MDRAELFALTTRVRRATRLPDVIALCDEVERLARSGYTAHGSATACTCSVTPVGLYERAQAQADARPRCSVSAQ